MNKHTPGPWRIGYNDGSGTISLEVGDEKFCVSDGNNQPVIHATLWGLTDEECIANAQLITTAPELLDSLKDLDNAFTDFDPNDKTSRHTMRMALIKARAVAAKAEGR